MALANIGSPHLRYSYVGSGYGRAVSHYQHCEYVGASRRRISPADGKCPLIAFFPSEDEGGLR